MSSSCQNSELNLNSVTYFCNDSFGDSKKSITFVPLYHTFPVQKMQMTKIKRDSKGLISPGL